jgi:hypothetical protein
MDSQPSVVRQLEQPDRVLDVTLGARGDDDLSHYSDQVVERAGEDLAGQLDLLDVPLRGKLGELASVLAVESNVDLLAVTIVGDASTSTAGIALTRAARHHPGLRYRDPPGFGTPSCLQISCARCHPISR